MCLYANSQICLHSFLDEVLSCLWQVFYRADSPCVNVEGLLFVEVLVRTLCFFAFEDLSYCNSDIVVFATVILHPICSST